MRALIGVLREVLVASVAGTIACVVALWPALALAQDAVAPPQNDRDRDGLFDAQDACPDRPEDPDGFEDSDGCPDPDNDGDGVLDTRDKCPNEAETKNGFQDDDGCPDKLPGATTPGVLEYRCGPGRPLKGIGCECPSSFVGVIEGNVASCKNKLGAVVEPPRDRDGDGILDRDDKCPNEAETKNGFQDQDGCPDKKVADLRIVEPRPGSGAPRPAGDARPAKVPPTGYRCGPGGKLVLGTGCTCVVGRTERRDPDGVSVCAPSATGAAPPLDPGRPAAASPEAAKKGTAPDLEIVRAENTRGIYENADLEATIRPRAGLFLACYTKALQKAPGITGTVVFAFHLDDDGRVISTGENWTRRHYTLTTLNNAELKQCGYGVISRMAFPNKGNAAQALLTIRFYLK